MTPNMVKQTLTGGGTGTVTLGAAVAGFKTCAETLTDGVATYQPYRIDQGTDWETGIGVISADGLSMVRNGFFQSSTNARLNVAAGATLGLVAIGAGLIERSGSLTQSYASADGAQSFGGIADQPDMITHCGMLSGVVEPKWLLFTSTNNATPVDLFADGAAVRPKVPAGQVWKIEVEVTAVVSNSPGQIGNVYTRELRLTGKPTGQVGATTSTAMPSDAGFTGSATASVSATGDIKVTVTGVAATTINWSVRVRALPAYAS